MFKNAFMLFFGVLMLTSCEHKAEYIEFNKEHWIAGNWELRGRMINRIEEDSLLIHLSKPEVFDLLGPPDHTYNDSDISNDPEDNIWVYQVSMGKSGPLGLGGEWLFDFAVSFDSTNHRVVEIDCYDN